jgi:uncharacterized RDD family membrane protein YckC
VSLRNLRTSEESLNFGVDIGWDSKGCQSEVDCEPQSQARLVLSGFAVVTQLFRACYVAPVSLAIVNSASGNSADVGPDWPGKRLGLPESGPRSVARLGRRIVALCIDWALAYGLAFLLFGQSVFGQDGWAILVIFAVLQIVFIATLSGSLGHLALGMRVVPLRPAWIGLLKPIARTILLCVVIPAVIWDRDQRGLHDRLVGTLLVRR